MLKIFQSPCNTQLPNFQEHGAHRVCDPRQTTRRSMPWAVMAGDFLGRQWATVWLPILQAVVHRTIAAGGAPDFLFALSDDAAAPISMVTEDKPKTTQPQILNYTLKPQTLSPKSCVQYQHDGYLQLPGENYCRVCGT